MSARITTANWYENHGYGPKLNCWKDEKRNLTVPTTKSIPIYWVAAGKNWSAADIKAKLDAAAAWYAIYCIHLDFHEVKIDAKNTKALIEDLAKANQNGNYTPVVRQEFAALFSGKFIPKVDPKLLVVMFVDEYKQCYFTSRGPVHESANFDDIPLILITETDKSGEQILTHELIHGLGKALGGKQSAAWVTGADYTWDEAPCPIDMGNPLRKAGQPFSKPADAPVDWASYWEWTTNARTIKR